MRFLLQCNCFMISFLQKFNYATLKCFIFESACGSAWFSACFFPFIFCRYYNDLGSCMPCSKCCGENKDVVENECKQKLGTASNMICSFLSSANRCDSITTAASEQETTTRILNTTTPVLSSKDTKLQKEVIFTFLVNAKFKSIVGYTSCRPTYIEGFMTIWAVY